MSAVDIYVGLNQAALQRDQQPAWFTDCTGPADGLDQLARAQGADLHGKRARVWLGGGLTRLVGISVPPAPMSSSEHLALARGLATQRSALHGPCAVRLEPQPKRGLWMAVVVEQAVVDEVTGVLASMHVRAVGIQPWWTQVQQQLIRKRPDMQALAICEDGALTLLVSQGDDVCVARTQTQLGEGEQAYAAYQRVMVANAVDARKGLFANLSFLKPLSKQTAKDLRTGLAFGQFAAVTENST